MQNTFSSIKAKTSSVSDIRLANLLLGVIFFRLWIYWKALFTIPINNYLVHITDISVIIGTLLLLFRKKTVKNKNFLLFAIIGADFLIVHGIVTGLFLAEVRVLDNILSTGFFLLPYFWVGVLPLESLNFFQKLLKFTLWYFCIQVFVGTTGVLGFIDPRLGYGTYEGGFMRANNTLGGATAGAHIAFLLLISLISISTRFKMKAFWLPLFSITAILLCFSRSAWLELFVLIFYLIFKGIRSPKRKYILLFLSGTSMLLLFSTFDKITAPFKDRIGSRVTAVSDERRQKKIEFAIDIITSQNDNVLWFGTGFGTSFFRSWKPSKVYPLVSGIQFGQRGKELDYYLHAPHNSYVVFLAELGVFGGLILGFLFIRFIMTPYLLRPGIITIGFGAVMLIMSMTETIMFTTEAGYALALMLWCGSLKN